MGLLTTEAVQADVSLYESSLAPAKGLGHLCGNDSLGIHHGSGSETLIWIQGAISDTGRDWNSVRIAALPTRVVPPVSELARNPKPLHSC